MVKIHIESDGKNHDPAYQRRLNNVRKAIISTALEIPEVVGWSFDMDDPKWGIVFTLVDGWYGTFFLVGELADDYPALFKMLKMVKGEIEFHTTGDDDGLPRVPDRSRTHQS